MKHPQFLHFFKKIGIISIIIISMVCATVHKTSALTGDSETSEVSTVSAEPSEAIESSETNDPNQVNELPEQPENPEMNETQESTGTQKSDNADNPQENTDTSEKSDDTNDSQGSDNTNDSQESDSADENQETDNTEEPTQPVEKEEPEISDDPQTPEITDDPEAPDNTESNIENNTENKTEEKSDPAHTKSSKKKQVNTSPNSEASTSKNTKIRDESSDAIYFRSDFSPSETFVALKDRVKYNEALPLDNIPSFITQEMIIGALQCQDETGYPASVTIAQIIQESGFGKYGPGGENRQGLSYLAYQYCNLFGIKGTGTAGTVNMRTGEQTSSGIYYSTNAGFRVYNTYTECIKDRTDLIKRVYSDLIAGVTDANTFAMRIGSRWATSLKYSQHLIQQMERYDLYRLDRMTLKDFHDMIGKFANPCPGSYVTSPFGYREFDNKFHKGIDLGTNGNSIPVYAAESGTIVRSEYDNLAGNWILIDHGNGLVTKYMHFSHTFVEEGQEVIKGQQIGLTGTTGRSTGIHLHFQVEENGVAVDPTSYLSDF